MNATAGVHAPERWPASLSGRFAPHATLGRGRFGTVFEVTDRLREARVAVKVLDVENAEALAAFKREFRALADLAHENLVSLHELGREGDTWFLVMECLEGEDLLSAVARRPEQLRRCFAQVALGLGFLHAAGRLHRDLKPANVRVTPAGRAALLDFGLSVVRGSEDGGLVGSAAYLAPEQAAGEDATPASDLYALGVMLCEALTGARPFSGSGLEVLALKREREARIAWPAAVEPALRALTERLLARDPSLRPTVAEVVDALDASLTPLLELRPEAPLIGREEALERLRASIAQPGPTALWLVARPGVGKTALLRRLVAALDRDVVVLASACFEHETTPYRAVDGVVDGLARWLATREALPPPLATHAANLARSFPALRHAPCVAAGQASASRPDAHLHESAVALRELLGFMAAHERRVVLVIDDLHWADADSIPLLREVLEGASAPPVAFIGAMRDETHAALEPLRRGRPELRLSPLSPELSRALLRSLLPANEDAEPVLQAAAGNPFLLQALAGHGRGLEAAVEARVARVPRAARRLLEAVCLTSAPLPRRAWRQAGALDIDEALALGHLRAGRLVRVRVDGTLEPYHDTLRAAVAANMPAPVREERHGGLAAALSAVGAEPEVLAEHLHGAGRDDEASAQAALAAERAAGALAFHHAAQLYGLALGWSPGHAAERAWQVARGRALSNAGRGAEAAECFLRAASLEGAAPTALELEQWAAAQLLRTGHIDRGLALTRRVLAAHELRLARTPRGALASLAWTRLRLGLRGWAVRSPPRPDPAVLARIDALTSASIGLAAVDSLRAADLMGRALLLALSAGEPRRLAVCLGFETAFTGNGGGAAQARTLAIRDRALRLAHELGDDYALASCLGGAGIAHFHLGELSEALAHLDRGSALFIDCVGAVKELFTLQLFGLACLAQQGELGELRRRLGEHLRVAIERGDRYAEANLRSGLPNLAWLGIDDVERAREELELARPGLNTTGYSVQHFFQLLGRVQVELYAGDGARLVAALDEGLPPLERSLLRRTEWIAIAIDWMKGRAALAKPGPASVAVASSAAKRIAARRRPWGDALAASLEAGVAALENDPTRVDRGLEAVEQRARAAELHLHATAAAFVRARRAGTDPASAVERARALGVTDLERMARVYLPGL